MQNSYAVNYRRPEFTCRDCHAVISVPLTFEPEYRRRIVPIGASAYGGSEWDRKSKHLLVTDIDDPYAPMDFASCRRHGTGERLSLAMIRRELAAEAARGE